MKSSLKNVTITLTLTEATAVYQYLNWATQVERMAGRGPSCLAKQINRGEWQRFPFCAVDLCNGTRPQTDGVVKTAVGRALVKLHHILLGDPVITPSPEGDNCEIHEYPNALVDPRKLEFYGDYARGGA